MLPLSIRQAVELFHLHFLRLLAAGGSQRQFILKGGCNLRFFFGSIRYSEDMDLDVAAGARSTVKNKVDRLLASAPLGSALRARGVELLDISAPKQTETTQRWKVGLRLEGQQVPSRTKVELSRRDRPEGFALEPVSREIAREHGIPPPLVSHYLSPQAIAQKVRALAGRPQTQARDIFDLQLLLARREEVTLPADAKRLVPEAIERAMSLGYADFRAQVVAFLAPEHQAQYAARPAWEALQHFVVDRLEELSR